MTDDATYWIRECISIARNAGNVDAANEANAQVERLRSLQTQEPEPVGYVHPTIFRRFMDNWPQHEHISLHRKPLLGGESLPLFALAPVEPKGVSE